MKRNEVLALDAEYTRVLDLHQCEDVAELLDDDRDANDWAESCKAMARAESYHFERNDEHRHEMEHQDAMEYT
jgi:hypothetical protein